LHPAVWSVARRPPVQNLPAVCQKLVLSAINWNNSIFFAYKLRVIQQELPYLNLKIAQGLRRN
jgi:hypothetical protein